MAMSASEEQANAVSFITYKVLLSKQIRKYFYAKYIFCNCQIRWYGRIILR